MKILLVNKFYYPQGGADIHFLRLEELLRAAGHEVAVFAMQDPRNQPSPWSKYFVSHVDFSKPKLSWQGLRVVGRMIWSFEAERKMRQLLTDFKPDVVHLHNIYHQLSLSILRPLRQAKVPVVQTLHDYALISPNYALFADGQICEHGKNGNYLSMIGHRCIKHSFLASIVDVLAYTLQGGAKPYIQTVKQFISPSKFLAGYVQGWLRRSLPMTIVSNFSETAIQNVQKESRLIYVGRLSHEKGIETLLRAMVGIDVPLDIVGTGPEEARLHLLAVSLGLQQVHWHGQQPSSEVTKLLARATATIVPSVWYENNPLVILESFVQGTPVVGSDIGGIPELVNDTTGKLVTPGNVEELHNVLLEVQNNLTQWREKSQACKSAVSEYTPGGYIEAITKIYDSVRA